jgi:ribosomal protein S18 acetylase RimI-like enzyme
MTPHLNQAMSITLRDETPDDMEFLLTVFASARAFELAQVPWSDEQKEAFLRMQLQAQHSYYREKYPNAHYQIILRDAERIGRLYVCRLPKLTKILDITVLPEFRNAGIGTGLIQSVLSDAAATGSKVQVYVETFNPSRSLFEKHGFSVIEEEGINYLLEWRPVAAMSEAP